MVLSCFPLLQDNTRLVRHGDTLYKLKIRYNHEAFRDKAIRLSEKKAHNEIEQCFRALLYKLQRDVKFKMIHTQSFIITPSVIPWGFPRKYTNYGFQVYGKKLKVYNNMVDLHISFRENSAEEVLDEVIQVSPNTSHQLTSKPPKGETKVAGYVVSTMTESESAGLGVSVHKFGRTTDGKLFRVVPDSDKKDKKQTKTVVEKPDKVVLKVKNKKTEKREIEKSSKRLPDDTRSDAVLRKKYRLRERTSKQRLDYARKLRSRIDLKNLGSAHLKTRSHIKGDTGSPSGSESQRKPIGEFKIDDKNISKTQHNKNLRRQSREKSKVKSPEQQTNSEESDTESGEESMQQKNAQKRKSINTRQQSESSRLSAQKQSPNRHHKHERQKTINAEQRRRSKRLAKQSFQETNSPNPEKHAVDTETSDTDEDSQLSSQTYKSQKVKLYRRKHSPLIVIPSTSRATERSSPRVSTVKPVKRRNEPQEMRPSTFTSPYRVTRQMIQQEQSEETSRVESLRQNRVTEVYRNFLHNRPDRHAIEQEERMELDKLQQLYQPTQDTSVVSPRQQSSRQQSLRLQSPGRPLPRQQSPQPVSPGQSSQERQLQSRDSPRRVASPQQFRELRSNQLTLRSKRKISYSLWGTIMDTLVTPTKKFMFGKD